MTLQDYPKEITKRIKARKFMGDDSQSWAVFFDNRPCFTGMGRSQVDYYKCLVAEIQLKKQKERSN